MYNELHQPTREDVKMLKIINVTVDFDHPVIFVQIMDINEREQLDDCIEEEEGKEVNDFVGFVKDIDVDVDFTTEFENMKKHVEKLLTSHEVVESYTFSSGELGHGFYAVVNDKNDVLDVEEQIDFI